MGKERVMFWAIVGAFIVLSGGVAAARNERRTGPRRYFR